MLSPLLFDMFFAAVLTVVLQGFSKDADILAELVCLKEPPTSMGPERAMDHIRRVAWSMVYVNDASIKFRSSRGIVNMM